MSYSSFEKALLRLWPLGEQKVPGLRAGIVATAPTVFANHGIATLLLVAQISHECDAGHDVVETVSSAWLWRR